MNNYNWYIYLIVIFTILDIILSIVFYYFYKKFKEDDDSISVNQELFEESEEVLSSNFGNNISIIAPIRKGKNVLFNQFMYSLEKSFIEKINKEIESFRTNFYWLDLKLIDLTINNKFRQLLNERTDDYFPKGYINTKDKLDLTEYVMNLCCQKDGIFNDFINNISIKKLFYTYIDDIYILNYRGFNVVSKTTVYSWVNNCFSKLLDDETLQIKCVYDTKNFYLERYMIVFEDEKSLDRGMQYSFDKDLKDKGLKELKCIFGNAFGSTSYWFTLKQLAKDDVSNERNLATNNILIKQTETIGVLGNILVYYRKKKSNLDRVYRKKYERLCYWSNSFKEKYSTFNSWIDEPNSKYRIDKAFYKRIEDFINSMGYLKTTFIDYENRIDLVGNTESEELCTKYEIVFPLYICWGVHDTNEWSCVVDELNSLSQTSAMMVQENGFYKNRAIKDRQLRFLYERKEKESDSKDDFKFKINKNDIKKEKKQKEKKDGVDNELFIDF